MSTTTSESAGSGIVVGDWDAVGSNAKIWSPLSLKALHSAFWTGCAVGVLPLPCESNTCETLERLSNYNRLALTGYRFHFPMAR